MTLTQLFTSIADAIRVKEESVNTIPAEDFPERILAITGTDTSDATATASDILQNKTAYANGQKITGNIVNNGALNYTPSTSSQSIPSGYTSGGTVAAVTSAIDNNIQAGNIKSGTSILGVTGTFTSDGNALAGDIIASKTAYVNGIKLTGTYRWDNTTDYNNCLDKTNDILEDDTYQPTVVFPPNWGQIGYSTTPQGIIDNFNYSKSIYDSWNASDTSMRNKYANDINLIYFPLVDTSNVTDMYHAFSSTNLTILPLINTGNVTTMEAMCQMCGNLTEIPLLNTAKVTSMKNFASYTKIATFPQLDTSEVTNMGYIVDNCTKLVTFPQLNTAKVTNLQSSFRSCPLLSNESLNNILAMCINATAYAGTKTLKYIGLSSDQATVCTGLSNWTDAQTAGWTTGY